MARPRILEEAAAELAAAAEVIEAERPRPWDSGP